MNTAFAYLQLLFQVRNSDALLVGSFYGPGFDEVGGAFERQDLAGALAHTGKTLEDEGGYLLHSHLFIRCCPPDMGTA